MISIGGIIGAGLFVGSSAAIAAAGPAVVLSYVIAGGLMYLVMRMLGELALAHPGTRSFTDYPRLAFGRLAGFTTGWLYWYFWVVVVPIEAIAGARIMHHWVELPEPAIGLVLVGSMTLVNLMSTRMYGEFEFWFASIKVAAILVFVLLSLSWVLGLGRAPGAMTAIGAMGAPGGFAPFGAGAVLAAVTTVFFSLTGAEITTVAAAESAEPGKQLARLSAAVIVRILFFYVASVALIVCILPWQAVVPGQSPFADAMGHMGYTWASTALQVVILTAVLSCLNSAFYVTSRVLFALAAAGDAPKPLVALNRTLVPTRSVWVCAVAGLVGILFSIGKAAKVFAFLVSASGALIVFVYMLVALAQWRLRSRRDPAAQAANPAPMPWHPWLSVVAVAGMALVLVAMAAAPARRGELLASLVALAAILLAGWLTRRPR
jgi:L-asparagine transporter-like permease